MYEAIFWIADSVAGPSLANPRSRWLTVLIANERSLLDEAVAVLRQRIGLHWFRWSDLCSVGTRDDFGAISAAGRIFSLAGSAEKSVGSGGVWTFLDLQALDLGGSALNRNYGTDCSGNRRNPGAANSVG
jgi:hypothetical protein